MADDDHPSNPGTQAFTPDFDDDDTGTHSWVPDFSDESDDDAGGAKPVPVATEPEKPAEPAAGQLPETESTGAQVQSVTVPGRYVYLRWWKLLLVVLGVWVAAAEVGLSLFYWWYHTNDKTAAVYVVLVYVVACVVAGVMLAMVQGRPLISALSLGVMSAPFGSVLAAAPLYGYYHCERVGECLAGVIPY
ncbi:hypothetical protein [Mycobacterium parmense]|uniref:Uncharacterized protein n=1 Tax=Mycobacterium parmense TaxID=185642 RepID=A0A7I7YWG1_9MYCO|nr:hypothetical protein [Mycobacterium parmense]MCV7350554.1 hypothetical protein [Mycobacterium parmense]ORW48270.1 hypothetical protein AWC20_25335 [Mycobacterium parmense]BBZ46019.1 hypothetical protein MPRM_33000 [Mycobacterium parmense]